MASHHTITLECVPTVAGQAHILMNIHVYGLSVCVTQLLAYTLQCVKQRHLVD